MSNITNPSDPLGYSPNLNYALWVDRVLAALVDGLCVMGLVILLYLLFIVIIFLLSLVGGTASSMSDGSSGRRGEPDIGGMLAGLSGLSCCCVVFSGWLIIPLSAFIFGLYNKVYLVGKRGYSIGQGVRRLKVVTAQGTHVPHGTLFLRLLVETGFGLFPIVMVLDLIWPLWDEKRQTLHDRAVNTFVIKTA